MKLLSFVLVAALATALGGCSQSSRQDSQTSATHPVAVRYHCPMHPSVVQDKKGSCPICGMDLVPFDEEKPAAQQKTLYRSTMNPSEVSDKPGKDSMGMEMVPFEANKGDAGTTHGLATVAITPGTQQRMGLTFGAVERRRLVREIRAAARIVPDETRLYHITLKTEGWIEHFHDIFVGKFIHKGEPLMKIYSPDLLTAQREFLNAAQAGDSNLVAASRRRLELLDMTAEQISALQKAGEPERTVTVYAPATGYVVERNIAAGHKVMPGEILLTLADLTVVWADAQIFQGDHSLVKIGTEMEIDVGRNTFTGKVSFISPTLDPETRTLKVRIEVPNADVNLKPEMWATARLKVDLGERLAIPVVAVIRTGERTYAFKDTGHGTLTPIELKLATRAGDWFEVLEGLRDGDQVVTSANFLVDSESQLKAALAVMGNEPIH